MSTIKNTNKKLPLQPPAKLFDKENYTIMIVGIVILIIGFFLMGGGKSTDPAKFNDSDVYSTRRITVAPAVILIGFIIEIFAIMKRPKKSE